MNEKIREIMKELSEIMEGLEADIGDAKVENKNE